MVPGDCGRCIDKRCCCCSNCAEGDVLSAANTLGVLVDEFLLPESSDRRRSADARIDDGADDALAEAGCAERGVDWARAGDRGGGGPRTLLPTGSMTDAGRPGGNSGVFDRERLFPFPFPFPFPLLLAPTL